MQDLRRWLATTVLASAACFVAVPVTATPLALGGSWTVLDQTMATGDLFTAPDATHVWTFSCASSCRFFITDLFFSTDRFEVYDGGALIASTPLLDWTTLAAGPFDSPPWTDDPDIAFASGLFSSMVISLGAGSHSLSIRDIHVSPTSTLSGGPFGDGTVAFRAAVPEPATLTLIGLALLILGVKRRKRG